MGKNNGQAMITLLFIVVISLVVSSAAIIVMSVSERSSQKIQDGTQAYYIAESGAENAILRLLRDPNYSGETLSVGDGTATITVSGSNTKTIVSTGTLGNFIRKIQTTVGYNNGVLSVSGWKEVQ